MVSAPRPLISGFIAALAVVVLVAAGATIAIFYMRTYNGPAHICGLSIVRRSSVAIAMLGSPIKQHGLTMGTERWLTGGLVHRPRHIENVTFWVTGPKGSATVRAFSRRAPGASNLTVMLLPEKSAASAILYDGPIDCAEWHG